MIDGTAMIMVARITFLLNFRGCFGGDSSAELAGFEGIGDSIPLNVGMLLPFGKRQ